ncbi:ArsR family transcriptional regulator [Candidatus Bathyarchaeota archaeon]|nr:ArsR family transcriptional regulator [Candidatus Bathyarchaeota archaeon]
MLIEEEFVPRLKYLTFPELLGPPQPEQLLRCEARALGCRTGMNHGNVDHHLKSLVEMGLVEEKRYESTGIRMLRPSAKRVSILLKRGMGLKIEVVKE